MTDNLPLGKGEEQEIDPKYEWTYEQYCKWLRIAEKYKEALEKIAWFNNNKCPNMIRHIAKSALASKEK